MALKNGTIKSHHYMFWRAIETLFGISSFRVQEPLISSKQTSADRREGFFGGERCALGFDFPMATPFTSAGTQQREHESLTVS